MIILILFSSYIYLSRKKNYAIPKIIWTYWDDLNTLPSVVKMCMKGWRKYNPDFQIILLTKENYKKYVNIPTKATNHSNFNDNPTRFADLVRLWTLAQHGGVWIDSSIILKRPLEEWIFPKSTEFSGFYIDSFTKNKKYPVIENWFFGCGKESSFMKLWRDEFTQLSNYNNVDEYLESRKKLGVDFQGISIPNYLAMHISAQKVLQKDKYPIHRLLLRKAENGPFKYLVDSGWNSEKALKLACNNKMYQTPIMKIRGCERKILESKLHNELSINKCNWI